MKNRKTKLNKTKLIARVMLVVLLLSSALNFCSCDMKYKYILNVISFISNTVVFDVATKCDGE